MNASPTKQRAPLAPLDANAKPSLPSPRMPKDGTVSVIPLTGGSSPLKKSLAAAAVKRPADDDTASSPASKKPCTREVRASQDTRRSRTSSPDSPSLFDTSAAEGDSSWATATTEPDVGILTDAPALLAPRQRGTMTREQTREAPEILRLRLGLASYKVRTGQTTVPLANLQRRPLPRKTVRLQSPQQDRPAAASQSLLPADMVPPSSNTPSKGAGS
ncbi:hypothetical protein ED733_004679 [Metarhizium rileyi]|uniref:Transcription factor Nrm1/Whi5 n=1 Tax=Metarhizium rileyi (strain RCEF 4871) TaxID=1649241 RepID=A0A5C6GHQ9_METRR|nr:hypothetical protein ED733_004679 [Metarhizium rileyi]